MLAARRMMAVALPCLQDDFGGTSWTRYAGTWATDAFGHLGNTGFSNWSVGGSASTSDGTDPLGNSQFIARDRGKMAQNVTVDVHLVDGANVYLVLNFDPVTRGGYVFTTNAAASTNHIWRSVSNAATRVVLGTATLTSFTTTTVRVDHDGAGHFDIYQNGTLLGTYTDTSTTLTGTWVGLGVTANASTSNYFATFSAC